MKVSYPYFKEGHMKREMKVREKQNRVLFAVLMVFYAIYAVLLFWFHPFVASAKEPVPGGKGNTVTVNLVEFHDKGNYKKIVHSFTLQASEGYEIVAYLSPVPEGQTSYHRMIWFSYCVNGKFYSFPSKLGDGQFLSDCTGYISRYDSGDTLINSNAYGTDCLPTYLIYFTTVEGEEYQFHSSGMMIFESYENAETYAKTGSLDGMIKEPELDKSWYLKDIRCEVKADDSPSSEAGGDATYIKFFWLTDNLQEGDLLEIRTHNVLKKIGGDQVSGFHDYITRNNNISAYDNIFNDMEGNERASYTLGQYDATKAWFSTVENKPLLFKSYETDIYYFRPYRNGKFGGWVKVSMRRATPTSSPYIDKVEVGDLDEDGNWTTDEKLTEENGGSYGSNQDGEKFYPDADNPFEGTNLAGIFKSFYSFMKSLPSLFGELPALVGSIVSFLPSFVIGFIAMGIVIAIILRIVGR